jgi:uncharacterized cupin superfamily protein
MKRFNVFDDTLLHVDHDEPDGYRAPYAKLREHLGATKLGATVVLLDPGQAVCPYHHELMEEEWLIVLSGTPTVRTPSGETVLDEGEVVCFPRGPAGAHQIANAAGAQGPARVLIVSEGAELAVVVYEDSDKVGVYGPGLEMLFRRDDERDYWDGEPARS